MVSQGLIDLEGSIVDRLSVDGVALRRIHP